MLGPQLAKKEASWRNAGNTINNFGEVHVHMQQVLPFFLLHICFACESRGHNHHMHLLRDPYSSAATEQETNTEDAQGYEAAIPARTDCKALLRLQCQLEGVA